MVEFSEGKFILCRELFLTRSSVNRTECSIPFCDRGAFRMFISSTASCTYDKVYLFIILKPCPIYFISVAYNDESARVDPVDCVAQSEYLPAVYYAHYYFLARACVAAASMQISEAAAQLMTDIIADLFIML